MRRIPPKKGKRDAKDSRSRVSVTSRRKKCQFCTSPVSIDYKEVELLVKYITEGGKILPRRITGVCAKHQRMLTRAIKRARIMALLPFVRKY